MKGNASMPSGRQHSVVPLVFRHMMAGKPKTKPRSIDNILFGALGEGNDDEPLHVPSLAEATSFQTKDWQTPRSKGLDVVRQALTGDAHKQELKYGGAEPSEATSRFKVQLPRSGHSRKFCRPRVAPASVNDWFESPQCRPFDACASSAVWPVLNVMDAEKASSFARPESSATTVPPTEGGRPDSRLTGFTEWALQDSRASTPWSAQAVRPASVPALEQGSSASPHWPESAWQLSALSESHPPEVRRLLERKASPRHRSPLSLGKRFNLQKLESWFRKIDKTQAGVIEVRELIVELRRNKEMLAIFEAIEQASAKAAEDEGDEDDWDDCDDDDNNQGGMRDSHHQKAMNDLAARKVYLAQQMTRTPGNQEPHTPRRRDEEARLAKTKVETFRIKELVRDIFNNCRERSVSEVGEEPLGTAGSTSRKLEYTEWLEFFRRSAVLLEYYTEEGVRRGGDVDKAIAEARHAKLPDVRSVRSSHTSEGLTRA